MIQALQNLSSLLFALQVALAATSTYSIQPPQKPLWSQFQASGEVLQTFVEADATYFGVPTSTALFIVKHESKFDPTRVGDDGDSRGLWQWNKPAHPEITDGCAFDVQCSTDAALDWIAKGNVNQWSTWRWRCKMYPYDNPPNCE